MAKNTPTLEISSGVHIPLIAYGTGTAWYKSEDKPIDQELIKCIKTAIQLGYTHIDAAEIYCTEKEIGIAIKESGVSRDKLFITTKVSKSIKDPVKALDDSLARLQVDHVDLFLIHTPFFDKASHGIDRQDAWRAMDKIHKSGKAKAVGVSNFRSQDIEEVVSLGLVKPVETITAACKKHGIAVEVYSPLCPLTHSKDGPVDGVVNEIAKKHNKSPEQVLLRWNVQKGHIIVTTSRKEERLKEYLEVPHFTITPEEEKQIDEEGKKRSHRQYFQDKPW